MFFYEHTNGKIIAKPDLTVALAGADEYFDSPFVVKWWFEPGSHTIPKTVKTEIDPFE